LDDGKAVGRLVLSVVLARLVVVVLTAIPSVIEA